MIYFSTLHKEEGGGCRLKLKQEEKEHQRPRGNNHLIELRFTSLLSTNTKRIGCEEKDGRYEKTNKTKETVLPEQSRGHFRALWVRTERKHISESYTVWSIISPQIKLTMKVKEKKICPAIPDIYVE